ncbi:MAG: hypothetical protein NZ750_06080 [Anaerolineae bacterium]|nr:hypothetical protein [Anaerolineae bacterium]MDW8173016.1 hypothetical protein [Anaerolineae bacterium]
MTKTHILSLGCLLVWLAGVSAAQFTPRPTPQPIAPNTPIVDPAVTATLSPNVCPPALNIPIGTEIFIKSGVNVRNLPTINGALVWNTVYDQFDAEGKPLDPQLRIPARVLEGPICANGYQWWRVEFTRTAGNNGWVAEGRPDQGYFIVVGVRLPTPMPTLDLTPTTCANPRPLPIGARAYVSYNDRQPKALRAEPRLSGALLATLVDGVPLIIEGGPVCSDGLNWWQVRVLASQPVVGWLAEGSPYLGYWIRLLRNEFAR